MVVRLTPARRATSSRATRRSPCLSNSTTAASRIASVLGSAARISGLSEFVVAQPHRQMIPYPVDRTRPPQRREALVPPLLALGPGQSEQLAGGRRQPASGKKCRSRVEHRRDRPPQRG